MNKVVEKTDKPIVCEITVPSDKSISHRAVMLASLAKGKSYIENFSKALDPLSTLKICENLGVEYEFTGNKLEIISKGYLQKSDVELNCANSGTTMRLMAGILSGQNFDSVLFGDESLSLRPMKRIIDPLTQMGANISSNDFKAPLKIIGNKLHGIHYISQLASAQVKSALIFAGLFADDITSYTEPYLSRNHTELMLSYMGADIKIDGLKTTIQKSELQPKVITIPGDISSATYFIVAGLIVPNSQIIIKNIGLNPTRTGILDVIKLMGGNIEILDKKVVSNELVGDIKILYSELNACEISGELIPKLIDEIPAIALLATQAKGTTIIKDAQDLRNKESDRIKSVVSELKKLGANIEEINDGLIINGKTKLIGNVLVDSFNDHRIAMTLFVAGLICKDEISIKDFDCINISFPEFENLFYKILTK